MNAMPKIDDYERARLSLESFRHLPDNWDGDGAVQIPEQVIGRAARVLEILGQEVPAPYVAATHDGGVQFIWARTTRSGRLELQARVLEDGDHFMVGYTHRPGFEVLVRNLRDPYDLAERVRKGFKSDF